MIKMIRRMLKKTWNWAKPYFTWRMAPCLALAWIITNGWAYVFIAVGTIIGATWMTIAGSTWAAILWMPWTLEKPLITIPLSLLIYRIMYRQKFIKKKNH